MSVKGGELRTKCINSGNVQNKGQAFLIFFFFFFFARPTRIALFPFILRLFVCVCFFLTEIIMIYNIGFVCITFCLYFYIHYGILTIKVSPFYWLILFSLLPSFICFPSLKNYIV